jgi:hypothetical protein
MGVGDSDQALVGESHQSVGATAAATTTKDDDDPQLGQDMEDGGARNEEKDALGLQEPNDKPSGEASSSSPQTTSPSPSPRRVLFGSVREALIASQRQVPGDQRQECEKLAEEEAGGGYVVLRRRQRSLSVGVASTAKSEIARRELAAEAPAPDAAGYTVIRRRTASDVSAPAPRPVGAPNESKRRNARRSHHPAAMATAVAASRSGDRKERRARTSPRAMLEHEPHAKPVSAARAADAAPVSHGAWRRSSDPLGSISSLSHALADLESTPRPPTDASNTRSPSAAIAPLPGPSTAPAAAEWLAAADRSLWAIPPADMGPCLAPRLAEQKEEEQEGSAWAAATSAGVLTSRPEPAWPPPPSSTEAPAITEDKVASWLDDMTG